MRDAFRALNTYFGALLISGILTTFLYIYTGRVYRWLEAQQLWHIPYILIFFIISTLIVLWVEDK